MKLLVRRSKIFLLAAVAASALTHAYAAPTTPPAAAPAPPPSSDTPSTPGGGKGLATVPPNDPGTVVLDGFLCSSNTNLQGSFGMSPCTSLQATAITNLNARTSHVIYYYYMGQSLVPDVSGTFTSGPSGGPNATFCQLSTPLATDPSVLTPNSVPTPICNLGSVHGDESTTNFLTQKCAPNGPVKTTNNSNGLYSKGYCDFSAMSHLDTLPDKVSINSMCPLETQWVNSLQPQFYENAFETVAAEVNAGKVALTTTKYQGISVTPCQYFADSLNRLVFGKNPTQAITGGGILGLNGSRASIQAFNLNATQTNQSALVYNDRMACANTVSDSSGDGDTSIGTCSMIFAQQYAEFLFSQLLTCEVTTIAQKNFVNFQSPTFNPDYNPSAMFKLAVSSFATCEDYAQSVAGLVDGDPRFWDSATQAGTDAQKALYNQCYLNGVVSNNYFPPFAPPTMAPVPPGGILKLLRNWAQGGGDVTSKLYVKTGVTFPYQPLPNSLPTYPPCQMSLVPIWFAARKGWRRGKALRLLALLLAALALSVPNALAGSTTYSMTCPSGDSTTQRPDGACVCKAKNMACQETAYDALKACYSAAEFTAITNPLIGITTPFSEIVNRQRWNLTSTSSCDCDPGSLTCTANINVSHWDGGGTETVDAKGNFSQGYSVCCNSGSVYYNANQSHDTGDPGCGGGRPQGDSGCKGDGSTGGDVAMSAVDFCQMTAVLNPCDTKASGVPSSNCGLQTLLKQFTGTDYTKCENYLEAKMPGSTPDDRRAAYWAALKQCTFTLYSDVMNLTTWLPAPGLAYQQAMLKMKTAVAGCNQAFVAAQDSCQSAYSPSCTDQANTMGTPPGDSQVFQEFMQACNSNVAAGLAGNCPPTPIAAPAPPVGSNVPANTGEQSLADAASTLNHNGNMLGLGKNNNEAAATAVNAAAPAKAPTAPGSNSISGPAATPASSGKAASFGGTNDANKTSIASGLDMTVTPSASDGAPGTDAAAPGASGFVSAAGGTLSGGASSGRRPSGVEPGASGSQNDGLVTFGGRGAPGAEGNTGPNATDELDANEPFLHSRDISIFQVVNRRYHKKIPQLL